MQALKKIFDEIDARTIEFEAFGITDDYVSTEWIKEIIRQHINNVQSNTVTEYCPHCEKEVEICWDVEEDGYQIFCPNCGKVIMLCGMCDARDGAVCDWSENGCKHSDERYAKVNNSSYISINDERLWQILF